LQEIGFAEKGDVAEGLSPKRWFIQFWQ